VSWAFYDDRLPSNRKVAWLRSHGTAGIGALGLHLLANTWSRHEGMRGFIPAYIPEQLVGSPWKKLVGLLEGCEMFEPCEGGWMIHDYDEYGKDDGISAEEKRQKISEIRAEAGRKGGIAKAAKAGKRSSKLPSKPEAEPLANGQQSSSPTPIPTYLSSSEGSPTVPAGFVPQVIRAYVESSRDAGGVAPEDSQAKVERSARKLLTEGYGLELVIDTARNAAVGGWTDLAQQMQRDAARAKPVSGVTRSTTEERAQGALTLADQLDQAEQRAITA